MNVLALNGADLPLFSGLGSNPSESLLLSEYSSVASGLDMILFFISSALAWKSSSSKSPYFASSIALIAFFLSLGVTLPPALSLDLTSLPILDGSADIISSTRWLNSNSLSVLA